MCENNYSFPKPAKDCHWLHQQSLLSQMSLSVRMWMKIGTLLPIYQYQYLILHIKFCLYLCISSEFPISYLKCGNHYHYKITGNIPLFFVQINTGYINIFINPRSLSVACPPWPNIIFRVTASWDYVQPQHKMPYDMYMNVGLSIWLFWNVLELWYFLVCHSCSHDLKF